MKRLQMTQFSVRFPWIIMGIALALSLFFGAQFPKVTFDNDPENMLSPDEPIRLFHNKVKERYNLYDFVIVGIVNNENPAGIFNVDTLTRIDQLTKELISLHQNGEGLPEVTRGGQPYAPNLAPDSAWKRGLSKIFGNDVNHLFDESGASAIINREIISPSVVDNIKQAAHGQLKIEYLMEQPPTTQAEALTIKNDAMNNPLYKGTLVSEDGKAIALYIPIKAKTYSYNVANLVEKLTAHWNSADQVFITGQPVAQDTFGVEMLVQMASSAPLAGLAIFLLLLFFFRRFSLIIAPMLVAIISVISTMGLLIGLGFYVHIMSSMIAIFLMPISVADSVHILSEFFDSYHRFRDKAKTIKHVVSHLFMPMLYTSLTTIAGFASLATTPIPPVRVFGLHVAFGVGLAWLLTMTFVPAYIMLFVRTKTLDQLKPESEHPDHGALGRGLAAAGRFSYQRWKWILGLTVAIIALSIVGISKINVNDNPVKWFTKNHRIRIADRTLNHHFGGTYTAYLTLKETKPTKPSFAQEVKLIKKAANERFAPRYPTATKQFIDLLSAHQLTPDRLAALDTQISGSWQTLGDEINYLDPKGLTRSKLLTAVAEYADASALTKLKGLNPALSGESLQEAALALCDAQSTLSFSDFVQEMKATLQAPTFKQPEMLAYVEKLQSFLTTQPSVGKSSSAVDSLKKANYELMTDSAPVENKAAHQAASPHFSIPETPSAVGQVFAQLEGMKKKDALFHLITKEYDELNLWVQLKSGDNTDMESVVSAVDHWIAENPPPKALHAEWAGLTYLNVVWQDKMVSGMMNSLLSSFVVVLIMMMILFRSPLFGLLAMIPLSVTITFIYGLIGLIGKDYDMPVAVLSSLTLGLSVDFAIHFLERARELTRQEGSWKAAAPLMFQEPALAISRNAIIISIGFTPLLFAPLVPYKTVGFFLATIMAVSWLGTLFILSALITALKKRLFK